VVLQRPLILFEAWQRVTVLCHTESEHRERCERFAGQARLVQPGRGFAFPEIVVASPIGVRLDSMENCDLLERYISP
jgi:hypothetical protein